MTVDRRKFMRYMLGMGISAAVGAAFLPIEKKVVEVANEHGVRTGNPGLQNYLEIACGGSLEVAEKMQCAEDIMSSPYMTIQGVITNLIIEEAVFRAVPSAIVDELDTIDSEAKIPPAPKIAGVSRRSLFLGGASTLAFGCIHNLIVKWDSRVGMNRYSLDTRTLPIGQMMGCTIMWTLQRTIGYPAAVLAHATHNLASISR